METEAIFELLNNLKFQRNKNIPMQTDDEFVLMANEIQKSNILDGSFAEIGSYEGFSSEFIYHLKEKHKKFFICDTFSGLQDVDIEDESLKMNNGELTVDYEYFCFTNNFIDDTVRVIKGYFPQSASIEMNESRFSFVLIDTDTHFSTQQSLNYFYNKMVSGGVIIIHDYTNHPGTLGVKKAVDDFISDKSEKISTYSNTTQGIIRKI